MKSEDTGKVIRVMGYVPPGSMYERRTAIKTTNGIYLENGGGLQAVTDPAELELIKFMMSMRNPHKIQC